MAIQDLNQLYQTATDAFRRATPTSRGFFGAAQYPNQGGITTLPTGTQPKLQPVPGQPVPDITDFPGGGIIQPKPVIPGQPIIESDDIEQPTPWKPPAVMPPTFDSKLGPVESIIPDEYGGFYQSQFYNPDAPSMGVLSPVTLPSGETITFSDSESARQFQQYLQSLTGTEPISLTSENAAQYGFTPPDPNMAGAQVMQYWDKHGNVSYQKTPETVYQGTGYSRPEVWGMANGGIVGLDYLTRRL